MLTPKQEKFCRCVVSGMTYKDSYMTAYDCKSDNAAYIEGTKLMKRDDINSYISHLRKPIEKKVINTVISEREKKRAWLWNMIENATNDSDRIRAMDILNKMDSEYINIQRIEQEQSTVDTMDTDTLLRLVK